MTQKLTDGLKRLGIELFGAQLDALQVYMDSVMECNKTYNLMKAENEDELAVNHLLDSLAAYGTIADLVEKRKKSTGLESLTIGDIGSGGGCPGIPLAVAFPNEHFVLLERMERRCVFLESTVRAMGLTNVEVHCIQADKEEREVFDLEVFRAFHPFDHKIAGLLLGMLKKGGFIAAYKARAEKIAAEMELVKKEIPQYRVVPLTVPFLEDHERNLVTVKK